MASARPADEKTKKTSIKDIDIDALISFIGTHIDFFAAPFLNYEYLDVCGNRVRLPGEPQPLPNPFLAEYQVSLFSATALNLDFAPKQLDTKGPPPGKFHIGAQFQLWIKRLQSADRLWARRLCGQLTDALNEEDTHTWHALLCGIPNFDSNETLFFKRDPENKLRELLLKNHELAWSIHYFMLNAASATEPDVIDNWYKHCALPAMLERRQQRIIASLTVNTLLYIRQMYINVDFFAALTSQTVPSILIPLLNYLESNNYLNSFMRAIVGSPPEYKEQDTLRHNDNGLLIDLISDAGPDIMPILEQLQHDTSVRAINAWYQTATEEQKTARLSRQTINDKHTKNIMQKRELAVMREICQTFVNGDAKQNHAIRTFITSINLVDANNDPLALEKLRKDFEVVKEALKTPQIKYIPRGSLSKPLADEKQTHLRSYTVLGNYAVFDLICRIEEVFKTMALANANPKHRISLNFAKSG